LLGVACALATAVAVARSARRMRRVIIVKVSPWGIWL
jgi:hypothetical protein